MSALPSTWAEVYVRLGAQLASERDAREWVREALERCYGVQDPLELPRWRRTLALQRACGAMFAVEEEPGDLAFVVGVRAIIAGKFARYFDGAALEGPPWRLDPSEAERPTYAAWAGSADFADVI